MVSEAKNIGKQWKLSDVKILIKSVLLLKLGEGYIFQGVLKAMD